MSDILSKLQNESAQAGQFASRGQSLINDFDTDKLITQGQDYAYRMGKEQLGALVGGEVVAGIHQGLPLAYKTGQTAWNAFNRPDQTAQAFKNVISGKVEEATSGAKRITGAADQSINRAVASSRTAAQDAAEEAQTGARQVAENVAGEPRNVVNETMSKSDNPYLFDSRNFKYNVAAGRAGTEGGAPALFGDERETTNRTPAQQAEFENPSFRGNVPRGGAGPESRPDFNQGEGSFRFQAPTQSEQQALIQSDRQVIQNLPAPDPAAAQAPAPSIGEARLPGEFVPPDGQVGASYNRPGTQLEIKPDSVQPNVATRPEPSLDTPTQPLSQTQDLRAKLSVSNETGEGDRIGNISEKYGNIVRQQAQDLSKPIGTQQSFTPRQEPGSIDLEDIAPVRISNRGTPLTQGARTVGPSLDTDPEQSVPDVSEPLSFPSPPVTTAAETEKELQTRLFSLNNPSTVQPAAVPVGDQGTGVEGDPYITAPPADGTDGAPKAQAPAPAGTQPEPAGTQPEPTGGQPEPTGEQPETDEYGLPKLAPDAPKAPVPEADTDSAPSLGADVAKAEATIAPEEEIADAIPGVGEILGGILGIGAAIEGAVQAASTPKPPPQQPMGTPASQIAFNSAPVIDSSDYHQL